MAVAGELATNTTPEPLLAAATSLPSVPANTWATDGAGEVAGTTTYVNDPGSSSCTCTTKLKSSTDVVVSCVVTGGVASAAVVIVTSDGTLTRLGVGITSSAITHTSSCVPCGRPVATSKPVNPPNAVMMITPDAMAGEPSLSVPATTCEASGLLEPDWSTT